MEAFGNLRTSLVLQAADKNTGFNILLTVHPNIILVYFTNLMHTFFILIHLLHSSTCFEHYYAHDLLRMSIIVFETCRGM